MAVASAIALCIISGTVLYNSDNILALDIPIIKDIFNMFGYEEDFKSNASKVNLYDENKYGGITIEDVLFDGKNLFISYKFESNGSTDYILYNTSEYKVLNDKNLELHSGGSALEKINDNTFIGTDIVKLYDSNNETISISNDISIKLTFENIEYVKFDKQNYKENNLSYNIQKGERKK